MNTAVLTLNTPRWAGVQVQRLSALARTQLTLFGIVDGPALSALRAAIADALAEGHDVWIDIAHITAVRTSEVDELSELAPWVA
jgi:hypothetical protein